MKALRNTFRRGDTGIWRDRVREKWVYQRGPWSSHWKYIHIKGPISTKVRMAVRYQLVQKSEIGVIDDWIFNKFIHFRQIQEWWDERPHFP